MKTDKQNSLLTGDIVSQEDTEESNDDRALLAPRYLLPALLNNVTDSHWSLKNIVASVSVIIVLAAITALYIHGANVTITTGI